MSVRKKTAFLCAFFALGVWSVAFELSPMEVASGLILVILLAVLHDMYIHGEFRRPLRDFPRPDHVIDFAALGIRNQVFFRTGEQSFLDDRPSPIDEDIPAGGPLFNSICYRLGRSWQIHDINVSVWGGSLSASMGQGETVLFNLALLSFDDGWFFAVEPTKKCSDDEIRQFVHDVDDVIRSIADVHDIRWFKDEHAFPCGSFHDGELEQGTQHPVVSDSEGEVRT